MSTNGRFLLSALSIIAAMAGIILAGSAGFAQSPSPTATTSPGGTETSTPSPSATPASTSTPLPTVTVVVIVDCGEGFRATVAPNGRPTCVCPTGLVATAAPDGQPTCASPIPAAAPRTGAPGNSDRGSMAATAVFGAALALIVGGMAALARLRRM